MKSNYLQNLTPEERLQLRLKAQESKAAKKLAGESLKQDWVDEAYMRSLASEYGVRLPAAFIPNTETKYLRRAASKIGLDIKDYLEDAGAKNLKELVEMNPDTPAFVEISWLLEFYKTRM